jgi:hypothetical protein
LRAVVTGRGEGRQGHHSGRSAFARPGRRRRLRRLSLPDSQNTNKAIGTVGAAPVPLDGQAKICAEQFKLALGTIARTRPATSRRPALQLHAGRPNLGPVPVDPQLGGLKPPIACAYWRFR